MNEHARGQGCCAIALGIHKFGALLQLRSFETSRLPQGIVLLTHTSPPENTMAFLQGLSTAARMLLLTACLLTGPLLPGGQAEAANATISLTCPSGNVIHVTEVVTSLGDSDDCVTKRTSSTSGLLPQCNGLQSCNETVTIRPEDKCPNGTLATHAKVLGKCLKAHGTQITVSGGVTSVVFGYDICSDGEHVSEYNAFGGGSSSFRGFLYTPAFPLGSGRLANSSCRCRLEGSGLSLTALDVNFASGGGVLSLGNGITKVWQTSETNPSRLVNLPQYTGSGHQRLDLVFRDNGRTGQSAWLEIRASGIPFKLQCGPNYPTNDPLPSKETRSSANSAAAPALMTIFAVMAVAQGSLYA